MLRTPESTIVGPGSIRLDQEALDLVIEAAPEGSGLFSLDGRIHITGDLADPSGSPDLPSPPAEADLAAGSGCGTLADRMMQRGEL